MCLIKIISPVSPYSPTTLPQGFNLDEMLLLELPHGLEWSCEIHDLYLAFRETIFISPRCSHKVVRQNKTDFNTQQRIPRDDVNPNC